VIIRRLVILLSLVCACTGEPAAPARVEQLELVGVHDDARDQYALLHDIEAALGDGLTRDGGAMAAVQRGWHGRRYRWEAAMVPLFCTGAARCFVAPFDHARFPEHRIRQGWMPRLDLDEAGFTALQQACAGKAACVVRFAGTMGRFVFDVEQPTSVEFSDLEIIEAREAGAAESWLASNVPMRSRT
jgi:hypothetical protein